MPGDSRGIRVVDVRGEKWRRVLWW